MKKKCFLLVILIGWVFIAGIIDGAIPSAAAKDFPTRTIEIYIGYSAGGGLYHLTRVVAQKASEFLGQPVVVVSKPGAGGTIAADYISRAKPDGYKLLSAIPGKVSFGNYLLTKVGYRNTDFEYFGSFGYNETFLYVMSNRPWETLEDLIDYARKHPNELKFPSISISTQMMMEQFCKDAGIKMIRVPMKGEAKCIAAMVGGHVDLAIGWPTSITSLQQGNKIKVLAAFTEERSKFFPDIPTFGEKGYPEVGRIRKSFYGIAGPKGMPKEVSDKLRWAFEKTFQDKEARANLEKLLVIPKYRSGEELEKLVYSIEKQYRKLYKDYGYKIENK